MPNDRMAVSNWIAGNSIGIVASVRTHLVPCATTIAVAGLPV